MTALHGRGQRLSGFTTTRPKYLRSAASHTRRARRVRERYRDHLRPTYGQTAWERVRQGRACDCDPHAWYPFAARPTVRSGRAALKDREAIEGFLGAPVVTSTGISVGRAVAADWIQAELHPLGDDELVFDGKNRTENNTFRLMFEGRYGFRLKKPFDFVSVELA